MSVKVVQGLIDQVKVPATPRIETNQQNNVATAQQAVTLASNVATQTFVSSEAVNISLRSSRSSGSSEKIKDYKEAKEVTESVAERIKSDDSAKDAHLGLTSASSASLV